MGWDLYVHIHLQIQSFNHAKHCSVTKIACWHENAPIFSAPTSSLFMWRYKHQTKNSLFHTASFYQGFSTFSFKYTVKISTIQSYRYLLYSPQITHKKKKSLHLKATDRNWVTEWEKCAIKMEQQVLPLVTQLWQNMGFY